jgi:predicted MFS family arabinose efflux permease
MRPVAMASGLLISAHSPATQARNLMSDARYTALTLGATITAAVIMALFFQAPPIPVAIGTVAAALWLLLRRRN